MRWYIWVIIALGVLASAYMVYNLMKKEEPTTDPNNSGQTGAGAPPPPSTGTGTQTQPKKATALDWVVALTPLLVSGAAAWTASQQSAPTTEKK